MKSLLAALLLTAVAAAQTTITVSRATAPLSGSPAASSSSSSSGSNSSAGASAVVPVVSGSGESFAEIPGSKKAKKAPVVPQSLKDSSADATPGLNADVKQQAAVKPTSLHFDDLVDGTDPVSVTVRRFQLFCNTHNMAQDEIEVRGWVKANQNIVASSPSEMQRKQQFPLIRERLIGMRFPKEWFEGGTGASPGQTPAAAASSK